MEYFVIGRNGIPLVYNGNMMGNIMFQQGLRFRFEDNSYDPTTVTSWTTLDGETRSWLEGSSWVKVQGTEENIWDWYYSDPNVDYAFDCAFMDSDNEVQVIAGNTADINHMDALFRGCRSLTSVCWLDTSSVTHMDSMFYGCRSLERVPAFNTSNVTGMFGMFYECREITTIPQFDTHNVRNMRWMFEGCWNLETVPLLDTGNVTRMDQMFHECRSLQSVPAFDTHNVYNMWGMLWGCSSITTVPLFDTHNVEYMNYMLCDCTSLTGIPLFATEKVTRIESMCENCVNVEGGALALYQQASSQEYPPSNHTDTFKNCGSNTASGRAELLGIPQDWGGGTYV